MSIEWTKKNLFKIFTSGIQTWKLNFCYFYTSFVIHTTFSLFLPVELILNLFSCYKRTAAAAKTSAVVSSATIADTELDFNAYNKKN